MTNGAAPLEERCATPRALWGVILVAFAPAGSLARALDCSPLAEVIRKAGFHITAMA